MTGDLLSTPTSDEANRKRPSHFHADLGGAFTPLYQRLVEVGIAGRIVEIGKIGPRGCSADFAVDDPGAFLHDLQASGHFCSDRPVGRMLHKGTVSLRELRKARGLHVAVGTNGRVRAHLDRYSPFAGNVQGPGCRYSPQRVVAHVASRLSADLFRFLFGHRLDCSPLLLSLSQPELDDSACGHETTQSGPEGLAQGKQQR